MEIPVFQHGGLNRDYFLAIMEPRNIGLGLPPSNEPEYGAKQPAVRVRLSRHGIGWSERAS
jgi:hypothetical protein